MGRGVFILRIFGTLPNATATPLEWGDFSRCGLFAVSITQHDDPSGISTYSVAGASFGYVPLWTALFSFPLMTAVQLMCARLGMVTGRGLACVLRRHYSRWVLWGACLDRTSSPLLKWLGWLTAVVMTG